MNNKKRLLSFTTLVVTLCIVTFFARTIFIGYKYIFFLLLPLTIIHSLKKNNIKNVIFNNAKLIFPFLTIVLFLTHFSFNSAIIKETTNICFVLFIILSTACSKQTFLLILLYLIEFAGILAIFQFCTHIVFPAIHFTPKVFETNFFSLVRDNNFYALHFILSIPISIHLFTKGIISRLHLTISNAIAITNIIASISRRAYFLYLLLLTIIIIRCFNTKNGKYHIAYKTHMSILPTMVIIPILIIVLIKDTINQQIKDPSNNLYWLCYKSATMFNKHLSPHEYSQKVQGLQSNWDNSINLEDNLFYNGDLTDGLKNWGSFNLPSDTLNKEITKSANNDNIIRLSRTNGDGYWQLLYTGRPIYYHKNKKYTISFIYKIVNGSKNCFFVGWNATDSSIKLSNLPQITTQIDNEWYQCSVSYTFKEDQINPICFLNSLQAGTTIDIKDIRLTCNDTTGLPRYVDQLPDSIINKHYAISSNETNFMTSSRTDRWRYAWELWQTKYNWKQKLFGHGFDYLEWYGEKFYNNPKRYDFPHNPIISAFLYSGIIGGVVYIWFLAMSLWLYWKKRSDLGIFFIMYLCCMFFCMFSGSSHFSFPLFAFLSFLPFVERKDENILADNAPNETHVI